MYSTFQPRKPFPRRVRTPAQTVPPAPTEAHVTLVERQAQNIVRFHFDVPVLDAGGGYNLRVAGMIPLSATQVDSHTIDATYDPFNDPADWFTEQDGDDPVFQDDLPLAEADGPVPRWV
jgi:hypothetical protein